MNRIIKIVGAGLVPARIKNISNNVGAGPVSDYQ